MEQETRIAVVGIIVENKEAVGEVNQILHDYSPYIIGRMGLPYEKKHVNIISVIVDAPADRISALSGKLGKIRGISAKVMYSKNGQQGENRMLQSSLINEPGMGVKCAAWHYSRMISSRVSSLVSNHFIKAYHFLP